MICRDFKKTIKLEMIGDNRYLAISVITGGKKNMNKHLLRRFSARILHLWTGKNERIHFSGSVCNF